MYRRYDMRKSQFSRPLSIALPPEHFEEIKRITDEEQISIAQWVRDAVSEALTTNQPKEDDM